ncbi:cysteine desulfurase [Flavobacterium columnare]|uniref:cysteine desulfurase family protein n=1 Tax=Flavobacterium columnare TaxID=996 RepID=UPI0007F995F8|nr:cysteine desulfurase family protein [Flavobacterium columnare]ANO49221.1 cysteine desulfurase [Flavobacterium columnare]APT22788.1 cysteine desulfurase [Flavobacterium columnare]MBF6658564.1 cysteine desulfurase [Flavobacterium columnare]PDS22232.1 cysteine desulfurase [Flavobacterium columnare] [Flavobacterium columnare NBRC 100251 = ATCC 23463]QOG91039.1 cysteine desulfurase [Flavobacterium columnare]
MKKVYLDNASTTSLYPEVIEEMTRILSTQYGNPSSSHQMGREAKNELELARKSIAKNLQCNAQEIIFTSCATEANNLILRSAIKSLEVKRIITSKIEHHAVLHTVAVLQKEFEIQVDFVSINPDGTINYAHLENLLNSDVKTLVSLMYVNNEIGTVLDLQKVAHLSEKNNAYFHTDAVQGIGKSVVDLSKISIDFLVASAHKFHGPKGVGFAFIKKNIVLQPILYGGEQEKGLRAGTESIHNIVGMAKALAISLAHLETNKEYLQGLKKYLVEAFKKHFPESIFVGNPETTQHNIVNIILPLEEAKSGMIVFLMDMNGVAISRGSACQSGSSKPSHVLEAFIPSEYLAKPNIRISLSKYNTLDDIDFLIETIKKL